MEIYAARSAIVTLKADDSPLTQADQASHDILIKGLAELFPDIPIVSEEGDEQANSRMVQGDLFWLVDPIDGTKDFLNRTGDFTICVALVQSGVPVFGIISAPAHRATYYGGAGTGSYKQIEGEATKPIHVATEATHVVLGSLAEMKPATLAYIQEHYPSARIEAAGSQLKFCYVAEGRADAYPRMDSTMRLWDVAAGDAILTEAGGKVVRPDGSRVDYHTPSLLVGDFIARSRP